MGWKKTSKEKISRALVIDNISIWDLKFYVTHSCTDCYHHLLDLFDLLSRGKEWVRYLIPAPVICQLIWRPLLHFFPSDPEERIYPCLLHSLHCHQVSLWAKFCGNETGRLLLEPSVRGTLCGEGQSLIKQKYQWKANWKSNASAVGSLCNKIPIIFLLTMKDMCKWFSMYEQKYLEK